MVYHGRWDEMPEDLEDLQERIYDGFVEGVRQGRKTGGKEIADKVQNWVKDRYMSPEVKRKTPEAIAILKIAKELAQALQGELSEVAVDPGEVRSKGKDLEKIDLMLRREL